MAQWHFDELSEALEKRGWRWVELPGDDYRISGTWELRRSRDERVLYIDFDGFDDTRCAPLEKSFGFTVRGTLAWATFGRRRSRHLWLQELEHVLQTLETCSPTS